MSRVKQYIEIALLTIATCFLLVGLFVVIDLYPNLKRIADRFETASNQVALASINLNKEVAKADKFLEKQIEYIEEQKEFYGDDKTRKQFKVLLRQADDIARLIDKANDIASRAKSTLAQVDAGTIPKLNTLISTVNKETGHLSRESQALLKTTRLTVGDFRAILNNPANITILANLARSSGAIAGSTEEIEKQIKEAAPVLVKGLTDTSKGLGGTATEVHKFAKSLNKPLTKKEKVVKFLLEAIIKSSPVLLGR